jgi:hypothetical protein
MTMDELKYILKNHQTEEDTLRYNMAYALRQLNEENQVILARAIPAGWRTEGVGKGTGDAIPSIIDEILATEEKKKKEIEQINKRLEVMQMVKDCINKLPGRYRTILICAYYPYKPLSEVCRIMRINSGQLHRRKNDAIKRLHIICNKERSNLKFAK